MGDYYSLRVNAMLTEEGEREVQRLMRNRKNPKFLVSPWEGVHDEFAAMPECTFIPYGGLCYAPSTWVQENNLTRVNGHPAWHFCCSIKVGSRPTIEFFLSKVLSPWLAEGARYELWNELSGNIEHGFVQVDGTILVDRVVPLYPTEYHNPNPFGGIPAIIDIPEE